MRDEKTRPVTRDLNASALWLWLATMVKIAFVTSAVEQEIVDGSNSAQFVSSAFLLKSIWATQVDARWRAGQGGGIKDDGVTSEFVEFSDDGKRLVTGNGLGKALILSAADGAVERTLTYITQEEISRVTTFDISGGRIKGMEVECGAFTPDGNHVILGGNLNGVKIFDLRDGRLVAHLHDEKEEVDGLGISPDGRFLGHAAPLACQIRSLSSWAPTHRIIHGDQGVVNSVDFAKDSSLVASAGNYGHVLLTSTSDWQLVADPIVQADRSNVEYIDVHGDLVAIAGEDAHVRLFRAASVLTESRNPVR